MLARFFYRFPTNDEYHWKIVNLGRKAKVNVKQRHQLYISSTHTERARRSHPRGSAPSNTRAHQVSVPATRTASRDCTTRLQAIDNLVSANPKFKAKFKIRVPRHEGIGHLYVATVSDNFVSGNPKLKPTRSYQLLTATTHKQPTPSCRATRSSNYGLPNTEPSVTHSHATQSRPTAPATGTPT